MKRIVSWAIVALIVISAGTTALADSIVQTKTFTGVPNYSQLLQFDQFNAAPGATLTSIEVICSLTVSGGRLVLDNDGAQAASGHYEFGANGLISSTDVTLLDYTMQPVVTQVRSINAGTFSLDGNPNPILGDYNSNAPCGMAVIGGTVTASKSGLINSAFWNEFSGTGTYNINAGMTQWSDYGSVSGVEYAVTPVTSEGFVKVIYNYTSVPEPGSMFVLFGGLSGVGIAVRRRLKK